MTRQISPLDSSEIDRYARHLVLQDVGGPGQMKLKAARVLVIGAGGLGSPVIQYLAAAGIGTIGIIDDDTVSLSNLQRQVIHATGDIGRLKVDSATEAVGRLNPNVHVEPHILRISQDNAADIIRRYDIVADGCDNFETRYVVSDTCFFEKKPLVTAALGQFDGTLTTFRSFENNTDGYPNPTYRCLFPNPPPRDAIPTCASAGILGALPGILGSMMAMEVIREIIGFGDGLVGKLLMVDARSMRFDTLRYRWNARNPLNGQPGSVCAGKS